jgi:hypothetical protein
MEASFLYKKPLFLPVALPGGRKNGVFCKLHLRQNKAIALYLKILQSISYICQEKSKAFALSFFDEFKAKSP